MLTAIGDSARIKGALEVTSEWVAQVYNIINNLLWTLRPLTQRQNYQKIDASAGSWAQVIADWPGTWSTQGLQGKTDSVGISFSSSSFQAVRNAQITTYTALYSPAHSAHMYYKIKPPTATFYTTHFDDEGLGWTEDKYNEVQSLPAGNRETGSFDSRLIADGVPPEPPTVVAYERIGWTADFSSMQCLLKYNVSGGFEYL